MKFKSLTIFMLILVLVLGFAYGCAPEEEVVEPDEEVDEPEPDEEAVVDAYPERPIRWTLPFGAGGGFDRTGRLFMPYLEEELGVPQIVENRPGAATVIGHQIIADADPEGYSLGMIGIPHTNVGIVEYDAAYRPEDFAPFAIVANDPVLYSGQPDKGWEDITDLIADIEANPGEIRIGSSAGACELAAEAFLRQRDLSDKVRHVIYDSGGESRSQFVGGHVDVYVGTVFANMEIEDQSTPLAVQWGSEHRLWPDTPTLNAALGLEGDERIPHGASVRMFGSTREFKEQHPERWEKIKQAIKNTVENEEFMADAEEAGLAGIIDFIDDEDEIYEFWNDMQELAEEIYAE